MQSRIPCRVLEISLGGCCLETEKPFRPGALASVELVLPICGMVLRIGGITQWTKKRRIGTRFTHVNSRSIDQLKGLIACLRGVITAEHLKTSIASSILDPSTGHVLAAQPLDEKPAPPTLPEGQRVEGSYDRLVHCGEGRLRARREDEWLAAIRSPDRRHRHAGALIDLSLGGCTVRISGVFIGELGDPLEVCFEIQGLRFLIRGVVRVIYDPHCVGIQFHSMRDSQREELALLLADLCTKYRTRLRDH
jgi:hypothetical protein